MSQSPKANSSQEHAGYDPANVCLDNLADHLFAEADTENPYNPISQLFMPVLDRGNIADKEIVVDLLKQALTHDNTAVAARGVDLLPYVFMDKFTTERFMPITEDIIASYGIDPTHAMESWDLAIDNGRKDVNIAHNLKAMIELEHQRPGICNTLASKKDYGFGVINFSRYPTDLLVAQYDQRDDASLEYGVFTTALYDKHQGTFNDHTEYFGDLFESGQALEEPVALRVYEVGSTIDLQKAWRNATQQYGPMSYRLIIAHSNRHGLQLGKPREYGMPVRRSIAERAKVLEQSDLSSTALWRLPDAVGKPGCETYVVACSTGADYGIVHQASSMYPDEPFTAPSNTADLAGLRVYRNDNGQAKLDVAYSWPDYGGEKRRFLGGAVVSASNN